MINLWQPSFQPDNYRCDDAAVDAVGIFAVLRSKASGDKTVFVRQYRPPMRGYTIEFPAGLVDQGETLEQGRRRRLRHRREM